MNWHPYGIPVLAKVGFSHEAFVLGLRLYNLKTSPNISEGSVLILFSFHARAPPDPWLCHVMPSMGTLCTGASLSHVSIHSQVVRNRAGRISPFCRHLMANLWVPPYSSLEISHRSHTLWVSLANAEHVVMPWLALFPLTENHLEKIVSSSL